MAEYLDQPVSDLHGDHHVGHLLQVLLADLQFGHLLGKTFASVVPHSFVHIYGPGLQTFLGIKYVVNGLLAEEYSNT